MDHAEVAALMWPEDVPDVHELVALLTRRPPWQADAACAEPDVPSAWFFPDRGPGINTAATVAQARQVCGRCLVAAECRAWSLAQDPSLAGIWGGLSVLDRRRLRRTAA